MITPKSVRLKNTPACTYMVSSSNRHDAPRNETYQSGSVSAMRRWAGRVNACPERTTMNGRLTIQQWGKRIRRTYWTERRCCWAHARRHMRGIYCKESMNWNQPFVRFRNTLRSPKPSTLFVYRREEKKSENVRLAVRMDGCGIH